MNYLSFDIKTTEDFLKKLLADYKEFCIDKTSSRLALNCAMTSWHLTDWTYNEFNLEVSKQFKTLGSFQKDIKDKCPSLQIMQDLANGTKHYLLTRHTPIVKHTNLHRGDFSSDFGRDFDISTLAIELKDGTKFFFEDEIETSINFWIEYLKSNFNLSI